MAGTTVIRQPGEGDAIWMLNSLYEVRASSDETGGELTAMEMTIPPGMGPPPHVHKGGESVYVLEGQVRYHVGGDVHEGGPGDVLLHPGRDRGELRAGGRQPRSPARDLHARRDGSVLRGGGRARGAARDPAAVRCAAGPRAALGDCGEARPRPQGSGAPIDATGARGARTGHPGPECVARSLPSFRSWPSPRSPGSHTGVPTTTTMRLGRRRRSPSSPSRGHATTHGRGHSSSPSRRCRRSRRPSRIRRPRPSARASSSPAA